MRRMMRRGIVLLMTIPMIAVMALSFLPVAGQAFMPIGPENLLPDDHGRFNGLWWGQHLGEFKDMRFAGYDSANAGEVYYFREGDLLQMGDAKLEYVRYGFWKDAYSSLVIGTRGVANWEALKRICFENFERWHKPDWRVERYIWVDEESAMTLEYNEALYQGRLFVYSKAIYERQLARAGGEKTGRQSNKIFWLYEGTGLDYLTENSQAGSPSPSP